MTSDDRRMDAEEAVDRLQAYAEIACRRARLGEQRVTVEFSYSVGSLDITHKVTAEPPAPLPEPRRWWRR